MLRMFLRDRFTPQRLRRVASADYDRDGDGIAMEFRRNLDTGGYAYAGPGNPYECANMQRFDSTADRPLNELFGAWWLGAFCSDPDLFVLIHNLASGGVDVVLRMVVRGCGELGDEAAAGARAAIPFVRFLHARTPYPEEASFHQAIAALEAIERSGSAGQRTARYVEFMQRTGGQDDD